MFIGIAAAFSLVVTCVCRAELFLRLTAGLDGARIEKVAAKELLSLVSDPRLDVLRVALDPPGENVASACLVSVGREAFLRFLRQKADAAREGNGPMCADQTHRIRGTKGNPP